MADSLYPIRLGYTLPTGEEHSVVITNEGQSESEYDKMFSTCGHDVAFSVDSVDPRETWSRHDELMMEYEVGLDG